MTMIRFFAVLVVLALFVTPAQAAGCKVSDHRDAVEVKTDFTEFATDFGTFSRKGLCHNGELVFTIEAPLSVNAQDAAAEAVSNGYADAKNGVFFAKTKNPSAAQIAFFAGLNKALEKVRASDERRAKRTVNAARFAHLKPRQ